MRVDCVVMTMHWQHLYNAGKRTAKLLLMLPSSKYANEINIPSEYELTDRKNLLVNTDNSKETKLNVGNLSQKKNKSKTTIFQWPGS